MHLLIVEDSEGDQKIFQEAFKRADPALELTVTEDADQALSALSNGRFHKKNAAPVVILLDLNLPKKSGKDFLQELKASSRFKHIPVLIMTSSNAEKDITECYDLGASSYLKKPMRLQEVFTMVEAICRFWMKEVTYPKPLHFPEKS